MKRAIRIALSAVVVSLGVLTVDAASAQTTTIAVPIAPALAPATTSAATEQLKVIVAEVSGLAQVRNAPQEKWQKAVVGMELAPGSDIRTGPRSKVICTIPPDQVIVVDRLGTISISEAIRSNGKTTTELLMKYGRTDYSIESAGKEHDATIRTPNSTLAVRGTAFSAYDQPPFEPSVQTYRGVVDFRYAKRLMSVGKGGVAKARRGPAETALDSTVVDPGGSRARTASENVVIANEISRGAVLGFDPFTQIATASGGLGPQTDAQLMNSLPGRLNFVIRWSQPGTDFNLAVLKLAGDPLLLLGEFQPQEVLYPGFGLNTTKTGGRIVLDQRGGPKGGQEIGFYNKYEPGIYGLQALQAGGPSGKVSFSAFLDGQPQLLFATALDAEGNPIPLPDDGGFETEFSNTITRNVDPGGIEVATALIPFPPELLPVDPAAAKSGKAAASKRATLMPAPRPTSLKPTMGPTRPPVAAGIVGPKK